MTLKEQLLSELCEQDEAAQKEIKKLEEDISTEAFILTTITGRGAIAGAARSASQNRRQTAATRRDQIKQQNAWVSEMLSKYKK